LRPELLEIDVPPRVRRDRRELVAGHGDAGGIRAVRGVGDDDLAALLPLPTLVEVRAHEEQARELALSPCRGLEADRVETGDLTEDLCEAPLELERTLDVVFVGERVQIAETREADEPLVDAGVVLHRARPEWIEPRVDAEVARRELREVAKHF